jgi:hypothetical protein
MSFIGEMAEIMDNGGRRTGVDRRRYSYSGHIPERRIGADRRTRQDRRQDDNAVVSSIPDQNGFERRKVWIH